MPEGRCKRAIRLDHLKDETSEQAFQATLQLGFTTLLFSELPRSIDRNAPYMSDRGRAYEVDEQGGGREPFDFRASMPSQMKERGGTDCFRQPGSSLHRSIGAPGHQRSEIA